MHVSAAAPPPRSSLFPYTTLFRSLGRAFFLGPPARGGGDAEQRHRGLEPRELRAVAAPLRRAPGAGARDEDRKSTRLNSSHVAISYAVICMKKNKKN